MHKAAFTIFGTLLTQPKRLMGVEKTASSLQPFQERIGSLPEKLASLLGMQPRTAVKLLGAAAAVPAVYHGLQDASEQTTRMQDLYNNRRQQLDAPMVLLQVKAAATNPAPMSGQPRGLYSSALLNSQSALANAVARSLVERPLNAAGTLLTKKLYTAPKHQKAFEHATTTDDLVSKAYKENPEHIHGAWSTMRRFGPSLAEDPSAVKSFLRQAAMSNGQIDYATIRMLAETEKFVQQARGQGVGP